MNNSDKDDKDDKDESYQKFLKSMEKAKNKINDFKNDYVNANNYDIPHIKLTRNEIEELNNELARLKINIRVKPMNEPFVNIQDDINRMRILERNFKGLIPSPEKTEKIKEEKKQKIENNEKKLEKKIEKNKNSQNKNDTFWSNFLIGHKRNPSKKRNDFLNGRSKSLIQKKSKKSRNSKASSSHTNNSRQTSKRGSSPRSLSNFSQNDNKVKEKILKFISKYDNTIERKKIKNDENQISTIIVKIIDNGLKFSEDNLKKFCINHKLSLIGNQIREDDLRNKKYEQLEIILNDMYIDMNINKMQNKNEKMSIKHQLEKDQRNMDIKRRKELRKMQKERMKIEQNLMKNNNMSFHDANDESYFKNNIDDIFSDNNRENENENNEGNDSDKSEASFSSSLD